MTLCLRHPGDPAPLLTPLPGLVVQQEVHADFLAALHGRPRDAIAARFADGHRAYVAWRDDVPAAFGWLATRRATIGEFGMRFTLPRGTRYLWNFVTLPAFRGQGIYPRLLDAIVRANGAGVRRFWVAHAPENHASAAGILKAGFTVAADFSLDPHGAVAVRGRTPRGGRLAAALLGLPEVHAPLDPCWHCGRSAGPGGACGQGAGCSCDYQRPERGCHAARAA